VSKDSSIGGWVGLLWRAPPWLVGLVAAVVWTVGTLGLDFLSGEQIEPLKVAIKLVVGLAFGCFVAVVGRSLKARNRSKPAVWPTPMNVQHAILTGHLPEGASAELWVPELTKIGRQDWSMRWYGPVLMGLFAAMAVFLIVDDPAHPWYGAVLAAFFLSLAVWLPFWSVRRRRARIETLIAQLSGGALGAEQ
jgi:hypothetical protein